MQLDQAKAGDTLLIVAIPDPDTATIAVRLGIAEGEIVRLSSKVPGGPLVITRGRMEIALGRDLCRGIEVTPVQKPSAKPIALSDDSPTAHPGPGGFNAMGSANTLGETFR